MKNFQGKGANFRLFSQLTRNNGMRLIRNIDMRLGGNCIWKDREVGKNFLTTRSNTQTKTWEKLPTLIFPTSRFSNCMSTDISDSMKVRAISVLFKCKCCTLQKYIE